MLVVYQRPDFCVGPWQILKWQTAASTSAPQRRMDGPNAGLCIPTYMLDIRQTNTSASMGPMIFSVGIFTNITFNVDSFLRLMKSIVVLLANPFHKSHSLTFLWLESARSSSHHAASLGWEKGLVHCFMPSSASRRAPLVWFIALPPICWHPRATTASCCTAAYTSCQAVSSPCATAYCCKSAFCCAPLIWLVVVYPSACWLHLLSSLSCLAGYHVASHPLEPPPLFEPPPLVAVPLPISQHLRLLLSCRLLSRICLLLHPSHG